jgi:hypothetical protein
VHASSQATVGADAHPADSSISRTRLTGRILVLSLLVGALVLPAPVAGARPAEPAHLDRFMWALAQQESGGDYTARNRISGAYGKYQIMPFNWPAWAGRYLGDSRAKQTPRNQETVARAKLIGLYQWLGSYPRVARWWLTGRTDPDRSTWSAYSRRYVDNVMALMKRAPAGRAKPPADAPPRAREGGGGGGKASPDGSPARERRVTTGWLNFRRGPGVTYARLGAALRPGTRLEVLASKRIASGRVWLRVRLGDDRVGWVSSRWTRR